MRILAVLVLSALTACSTTPETKRGPNQEDMQVVLRNSKGESKAAANTAQVESEKDFNPISSEEIDAAIDQQNLTRQAMRPETPAPETSNPSAEYVKEAVSLAAEHIQNTHRSTLREAGPVNAATAQRWLTNGNTRFTKGFLRNDGASALDRRRLANSSEKPHSVIVACSESRVPPEVLFDQKLGEVFVVRSLAHAMADNTIASIEYAVERLGANLVVLLGHDSCGGLDAALAAMNGNSAHSHSPAMQNLIAEVQPRLESRAGMTLSPGMIEESWLNLSGLERELIERSAIVRDAVSSGDVKVVKALYRLESGRVEWR